MKNKILPIMITVAGLFLLLLIPIMIISNYGVVIGLERAKEVDAVQGGIGTDYVLYYDEDANESYVFFKPEDKLKFKYVRLTGHYSDLFYDADAGVLYMIGESGTYDLTNMGYSDEDVTSTDTKDYYTNPIEGTIHFEHTSEDGTGSFMTFDSLQLNLDSRDLILQDIYHSNNAVI